MRRSLLVSTLLLFFCCFTALAQNKKVVTGIIKDTKGAALPGVTVKEKGVPNGTTTGEDGSYKLSVGPNATLVFSFVGYAPQEVVVGGQNAISPVLSEDNKDLGEVVVTAMGIKKDKRKLGYAISTVGGDEIIKSSPTNVGSALYGKAAGVRITAAPGGGTSAVNIKIRGLNSVNSDGQPLIVVDGVPIRKDVVNTGDYWSDSRIRGNSLLDINPENIKDLSILKGAAATALYGSDGANGVVMITTKNGSQSRGLGVDFNYSLGLEKVSVLPDVQTEYGPGYPRDLNQSIYGTDADGWIDQNGPTQRPSYRASSQFGPKFDGRTISYWDGSTRNYVGHKDNWKKFYQTGNSSIANIAVSNSNDKMNYRFSYTRNDYKGIQRGGKQNKNTFNLNTTYKLNDKISTDVVVSYVNEYVHNRPQLISRVTGNFGGFFSAADDMDDYLRKYQTTKGYKFVMYNQDYDNDEKLKYHIRAYDLMNFFWGQLRNSYDENSNRVMSSATLNYKDIIPGLTFRARIGNDYTGYRDESKEYAEYPLAFGNSGKYGMSNNQYSIVYGDMLLSYNKALSKKFNLSASLGYQARKEDYRYSSMNTDGGLTQENWFSLSASKNVITYSGRRSQYLQDGVFGIVGLDYNNYLFLEVTDRQERVSSLHPDNNSFNYPSASLSFELSKAVQLPKAFTYAKLRGSYGIVATGVPGSNPYQANVTYTGYTVGGYPYLYPSNSYGNNGLKPERKHESEFGFETRLFDGRLGVDAAYYNNVTKGQIIPLTIASTTGATSILTNVGDMANYGLEFAVSGTPITSKNFEWNVRATLSFNKNKMKSLADGSSFLNMANVDNNSLQIWATVGQTAGDIMGYAPKTDAKGNTIINADGYQDLNFENRVKFGNIQPKGVGGISNNFRYKNWSMGVLVDVRWGGQIISTTNLYGYGQGMWKSTLEGRDAEHGGLSYYENSAGKKVQVTAANPAPGGVKVYNDGMMFKGVTADGAENTTILDAGNYYFNSYNWGSYSGGDNNNDYRKAVYDNDYIKFREVTLNYTIPSALTSKLHIQNLTVGLYGRNLFYFYKTLPNLDPEVGIGSTFVSQGIEMGTSAATRSFGANVRLNF